MNTYPQPPESHADAPRLIGLSGGKDSTGLAVWLCTQEPEANWHLVHVRHGLRDDAADACAAKATAATLNRPFHEVPADWAGVIKAAGPEDGARQARYAAFIALAKTLGATHLYLGHSADDQAETVLLRLVRGTGPTGMAGMQPVSQFGPLTIHRPLLGWARADVRTLAAGYTTVEDPTNDDRTQRRAYLRHEVIPRLANARPDGQPVAPAISAFAQLQREQNQLLNHLIAPYRGPVWGPLQRVPNHPNQPAALTRYLIHHALDQGVSRELVGDIEALANGERRDLPQNQYAARDQFGWIIGPKTVAWSIEENRRPAAAHDKPQANTDPMAQYTPPWNIPVDEGISIEDLAVRVRGREDSRYKKIFEQFPKSLRAQLPVVYTVKTGEVVAIGPLSLQHAVNRPDRAQWITLTPGTMG